MRRTRLVLLSVTLALSVACGNAPTALRRSDLESERAAWAAHHLTRYAYLYEETGFLNSYSGRLIRLVILNDSVSSAQDVTTDSLLPAPGVFPTLDELFAQAEAALAAGTLTSITFDSTFAYPRRMDLAGPPDASGSILASSLELLP